MNSKLAKRLVRRIQFASFVAKDPAQSKALYRLIAKPTAVDAFSLDGLSETPTLDRLLSSSLMSSGNDQVPLKVARHMYLKGRVEEALNLVRRTPGRAAQLEDGWLSLHKGEIDRALDIYSGALDRQRTKQGACKNLALCHYLKGDLGRAIDLVLIGAAIYPRNMALMTLFSRIVRDREDIARYLSEKVRIARNGFTTGSAAQFVRTCGRAGAVEEGEREARAAIVNLCHSEQSKLDKSDDLHHETGLKKGAYSSDKGQMILSHISELATTAQIRFFLMGGTLLGLVRDKQLLPWDKDLDFGCFAEEASVTDLWKIFLSNPYFIPMGSVGDRLIKLRHLSGITVDIFINFREEGSRWHGGQFVFWKDREFTLQPIQIQNRTFYIPDNPEAYLENHYGENWRAPDPHFDVFWEAPDCYSPNKEHRYMNTIAKGLQLLSSGSKDMLKLRLDRAEKAKAEDVVAGFRYILDLYNNFKPNERDVRTPRAAVRLAD